MAVRPRPLAGVMKLKEAMEINTAGLNALLSSIHALNAINNHVGLSLISVILLTFCVILLLRCVLDLTSNFIGIFFVWVCIILCLMFLFACFVGLLGFFYFYFLF